MHGKKKYSCVILWTKNDADCKLVQWSSEVGGMDHSCTRIQACHWNWHTTTRVRFGSQPAGQPTVLTFFTARDGLGQRVAELSRMHTCAPSLTDPRRIRCQTGTHNKIAIDRQGLAWGPGGPPLSFNFAPRLPSIKSPPLVLWHLHHSATCGWSSLLLSRYHKAHVSLIGGSSFGMGSVGKEKKNRGKRKRKTGASFSKRRDGFVCVCRSNKEKVMRILVIPRRLLSWWNCFH